MNLDYATLPDSAPTEQRKKLEQEIENYDTQVRTAGIEKVAAAVYLYYRAALNSVGVAAETGMKPPHVRILLYRLQQVWEKRFNDDGTPKAKLVRERKPYVPKPRKHAFDWNLLPGMCDAGMTIKAMAAQLGVSYVAVDYALNKLGVRTRRAQQKKKGRIAVPPQPPAVKAPVTAAPKPERDSQASETQI